MARPTISPGGVWHTQNFLYKRALVERLLKLAQIRPEDLVLDLGAGRGLITEPLAQRCRRVVAVECDPGLAAGLRRRFSAFTNVTVCEDDALRMRFPHQPYKVFANIPFDGTSRLLSRLTSLTYAPDESYLVVQREAAARIIGWPRQTLFSVLRQPWFDAQTIYHFRRTDFMPHPRVDVVFLRLRKRGPPLVANVRAEFYRDFVSACFVSRDRTVACTLQRMLGRHTFRRLACTIDLRLTAAPSQVPVHVWIQLFDAVASNAELRRRLKTTRRSTM